MKWKCTRFVLCNIIFQLSSVYYWKEYALTIFANTTYFKARYTGSYSLLKPFSCPFIHYVRLRMCIVLMKLKGELASILLEVWILWISTNTVWLRCNLQNRQNLLQKNVIHEVPDFFHACNFILYWMLLPFDYSNTFCLLLHSSWDVWKIEIILLQKVTRLEKLQKVISGI